MTSCEEESPVVDEASSSDEQSATLDCFHPVAEPQIFQLS
jgi:hypothetical protein